MSKNGDPEKLGPPPVEPLSDITWARVERNLWERLDAGEPASVLAVTTPSPWRKRMVWVAAPLAAAAALAIVVSMRSGEDTPSGQGSDGPMRVVSSGASSSVSYGDAHVTLDAESAVVMSRAAEETTAIVERGAAWFAIAPRGDRPPFVVVAGDTTVRVVGTRFRVARFAEITTVEVEHGLVDARFRGRRVSIGAGQSWTSAHPDDVAPVRTAAVTPVPTPETPARVEPVLPEPPAPTVREPKPIDPPPPPTPPAPPTTRPEPTPGSSATKPSAPGKPKPAKPGSADDDRVRFEKLAALETRDPGAAIAGYLELSARGGRWAEVGLYAAARLAADRRDPRATNFLTVYLRRFPRGANADDVRVLLARIQNGATR